jgi:uncharacterized Zn finger protein
MSGQRPSHFAGAQLVACPNCNAQLEFCRSDAPHIDDSGFESYGLECKECGAVLAGIIDPYDDALLLAQVAG